MRILFIWPSLDCPPGINHGLTSLSAVVKEQGHETSLIHVSDALWPVPGNGELLEKIKAYNPDLVAFSVTTQQFPWTRKAAAFLRRYLKVPFLIGGVHCTMDPESVAGTGLFDYVCVGEGEDAVSELLRRLERGQNTEDCPNMYVRKGGKTIRNPVGPFPGLEKLPSEDYELFDLSHILAKKGGWLSIITSRGCPYSCTYCFNAGIVARYKEDGALKSIKEYLRHRPVSHVIAEIRRLGERYPGIRTLIFDDDLFTLNKDYVVSFCRAYKEAGIKYPFVVNAHVLAFSGRIACALKEAGCRIVKFGIESGSGRVRREILNRRMSNRKMIDAVQLANASGLHSSAFVMFGLPTETRQEVLETLRVCAESKVGRFRWAMFYPYPGTEAHEITKKAGLIREELLESSGNYFEGSCLNFPPEHALFLDKLNRIAPWYVNSFSGLPCAGMYRKKVREIENLSASEWEGRRDRVFQEDRELSDELLSRNIAHYSIRFSKVMGVHSDYVLEEMREADAAPQRSASGWS